jgi:hypothetical protein
MNKQFLDFLLGIGAGNVGFFGGDLHNFFVGLSVKKGIEHTVRRSRVRDVKVTCRWYHDGLRAKKEAVRRNVDEYGEPAGRGKSRDLQNS